MTDTYARFPFDRDFQIDILSLMTKRSDFCNMCTEIIQPEYFEDKVLVWFFQTIRDYYKTVKLVPTLSPVLTNEIRKAVQETKIIRSSDLSEYKSVLSALKSRDAPIEYAVKEVVNFCRRQATKKAILDCATKLDTASDADWDKMVEQMKLAVSVGSNMNDMGMDYWATIKERVAARIQLECRRTVPTGIPELDKDINGGVKDGQLGVWLGATGRGKSLALPHCGRIAVELGLKVAHYSLELNEYEVSDRYDAAWSDVPIHNLVSCTDEVCRNLEERSRLLKERFQFNNSLMIKFYPARRASMQTIESHLQQLESSGWKPDLLIIDYGDLLKPTTSYNSLYEDLGIIFTDLRGLAGVLKLPIWTATQARRDALSAEIVDLEHIGDSIQKAQIADLVIALCVTREESQQRTMRLFGAKNRNGPPNFIVKIPTNFSKMQFFDYKTWELWHKTARQMEQTQIVAPPTIPPANLGALPVHRRLSKMKIGP